MNKKLQKAEKELLMQPETAPVVLHAEMKRQGEGVKQAFDLLKESFEKSIESIGAIARDGNSEASKHHAELIGSFAENIKLMVDSLEKSTSQDTVIKQLSEIVPQLKSVEAAISGLEKEVRVEVKAPDVNVEAPMVNVEAPKVVLETKHAEKAAVLLGKILAALTKETTQSLIVNVSPQQAIPVRFVSKNGERFIDPLELKSDQVIMSSTGGSGSGSSQTDYSERIMKLDESGNYLYRGYAVPGSGDADSVWRIERFDFSADPDVTKLYAGGVTTYTHSWSNRASLTYS